MIITRTPFRISFFGGGTDYPAWFRDHGGAVLATTIDKYCYISLRYLPPFFKHKTRIVYSKMEHVNDHAKIDHPSIRACLKYLNMDHGLEIHHDADLPARTGLGSSSSFTVGLLNALYALKGKMKTKEELCKEAIFVEQEVIGEKVGSQDQTLSAFGGFNYITFQNENDVHVSSVTIHPARIQELKNHLLLFFTGFSRIASVVAEKQIKNFPNRKKELQTLYGFVDEALGILKSNSSLVDFGKLLRESWKLKKTLSSGVTTPKIDEIYEVALKNGAIGGKLLGAGGGGFLLIFAEPQFHAQIKHKLKSFLHVPFEFENLGSQVIFYKPDHVPTV